MPYYPLSEAKRVERLQKRTPFLRGLGVPKSPSPLFYYDPRPQDRIRKKLSRTVAVRRTCPASSPVMGYTYASLPPKVLGEAVGSCNRAETDVPGEFFEEVKRTCRSKTKEIGLEGEDFCLEDRLRSQDKHVQECRKIKNLHNCRVFIGKCTCYWCVTGETQEVPPPFNPQDDSTDCTALLELTALLKECQRFLRVDQGISPVRLPELVELRCGTLRSVLRNCYGELTPLQELSVKTSQKLEGKFCEVCEERYEEFVSSWRSKRFSAVEVDHDHVRLFSEQFGRNVESGWNRRKSPYVPSGHATIDDGRRAGGSWNRGSFKDYCRPELVLSSGKPRVVTLFSEYNTSVLYSLHHSLYDSIRKRKWVLVGEPENQHVNDLNGAGEFCSLDYRAATDSFKAVYVRAALEVLISKAVGLSAEEERCLWVLGNLKFEPNGEVATVGQPMGSLMSFPLLCLFNKTVQDLALNDLLQEKKIGFKEWTKHRCLVNGDDGLTRAPRAGIDIKSRIAHHSGKVGMEVNDEKTSVSDSYAEINSTLFYRAPPVGISQAAPSSTEGGVSNPFRLTKRVKSNCRALRMGKTVKDVLGYAQQATSTVPGFLSVVRRNRKILGKQSDKFLDRLSPLFRKAVLDDPKLYAPLHSSPASVEDCPSGRLAMCCKSEDYNLSRQEEFQVITSEVERIRTVNSTFAVERKRKFVTVAVKDSIPHKQVLRPRRKAAPELTLKCLEKRHRERKWEVLRDSSPCFGSAWADEFCAASQTRGVSRAQFIVDKLRTRQAPPPSTTVASLMLRCRIDPVSLGSDSIRL